MGGVRAGEAMRRVGKGSRREGEPQGRGETRGSNCLGQRVRARDESVGEVPRLTLALFSHDR